MTSICAPTRSTALRAMRKPSRHSAFTPTRAISTSITARGSAVRISTRMISAPLPIRMFWTRPSSRAGRRRTVSGSTIRTMSPLPVSENCRAMFPARVVNISMIWAMTAFPRARSAACLRSMAISTLPKTASASAAGRPFPIPAAGWRTTSSTHGAMLRSTVNRLSAPTITHSGIIFWFAAI